MFVQVIEFKTSRIDEVQAAVNEYRAKTEGRRTATRGVLCADRDNPGTYVNVVFFPSYEEAMKNSEMAETQEFSGKMMELGDGVPRFLNLDVLFDES